MSSEQQAQFRNRQAGGDVRSTPGTSDAWLKSGAAKAVRDRDNVNLYLSERMLDLASELASEARMGLRDYLTEALKYVLLVQGKRLGKTDKYVPEFVNSNPRKISTWKSEPSGRYSPPAEAAQSAEFPQVAERKYGSRSRSEGQSSDRKYGSRTRSEGQSSDRKYGSRTRSEGQSGDRKYGSRTRSEGQSGDRQLAGQSGFKSRSAAGGFGRKPRSQGQASGFKTRAGRPGKPKPGQFKRKKEG